MAAPMPRLPPVTSMMGAANVFSPRGLSPLRQPLARPHYDQAQKRLGEMRGPTPTGAGLARFEWDACALVRDAHVSDLLTDHVEGIADAAG